MPDADGWDFSWDSNVRELRFKNDLINQKFSIKSPEDEPDDLRPIPSDKTPVDIDGDEPSPLYWREALRTALTSNYGTQIIKLILERGSIDINHAIIHYEEPCVTKYLPDPPELVPLNPLEWAVEHGRVDLFRLFLEAGADANRTADAARGPALMKAVRVENLPMVQVLAPLTGRISCTRALGLAVDQQSPAVVEALLEARAPPSPPHEGQQQQQQQHVRCDFEDGDHPPIDSDYISRWPAECSIGSTDPAVPTDFTPPLVRAVRFGNAGLVRALLAHGADPNVGYHRPHITIPNGYYDTGEKPEGHPPYPQIECGRPAQLAMELHGHGEVVRSLLEAGADVMLPRPVAHSPDSLPMHTCKLPLRGVYLEVTAALEAAVAQRCQAG
ncbi:hypothetical protein PG984_002432 [Apiospora sp. TS-2023a]